MKRPRRTVVIENISVSTTSGMIPGKVILNVRKSYPFLTNEFGGKGVFKDCDGNGKVFDTREEAMDYAWEHGYIQLFSRKYFDPTDERIKTRKEAKDMMVYEKTFYSRTYLGKKERGQKCS